MGSVALRDWRADLMQLTILGLTLADRETASSRIRGHLPLDSMESKGHKILRVIARDRLWPLKLLAFSIFNHPDVIFLQKVMPPAWLLSLLKMNSRRLVFDLDDAIYLGYPGDSSASKSRLRRRICAGLKYFDFVITSNSLIRADLKLATEKCAVFPGPSPQVLASPDKDPCERVVMWLGSPSTESNVKALLPEIRQALPGQSFLLVGCLVPLEVPGLRCVPWTPEEEVDALIRSHVGIMPLESSEWNKRKAGYKILEYLRGGVIPVVEEGPILRTLLGREAETLCQVIHGSGSEDWSVGIEKALAKDVDAKWISARDAVFARWSTETFANHVLGQEDLEE